MNFEKAFINSWKTVLEEREISSDINFYKTKEINKNLPKPKREGKKQFNVLKKITFLIKTILFFFVLLNILYLILRLSGFDLFKPYGDVLSYFYEKVLSLRK